MYAVVEAGGKQHRVREGDLLRIEKVDGDVGSKVIFDNVLMVGGEGTPKIGMPLVEGAKVNAEIVAQGKSKKVIVFQRKRRKHMKRLRGHRQPFTDVKITGIVVN